MQLFNICRYRVRKLNMKYFYSYIYSFIFLYFLYHYVLLHGLRNLVFYYICMIRKESLEWCRSYSSAYMPWLEGPHISVGNE